MAEEQQSRKEQTEQVRPKLIPTIDFDRFKTYIDILVEEAPEFEYITSMKTADWDTEDPKLIMGFAKRGKVSKKEKVYNICKNSVRIRVIELLNNENYVLPMDHLLDGDTLHFLYANSAIVQAFMKSEYDYDSLCGDILECVISGRHT